MERVIMNSSGFIRGYMAKNMNADLFIRVVAEALAREFEEKVNTVSIKQGEYEILFKDYRVTIHEDLINKLKAKSPYGVDKYLLRQFADQGFNFDERKSQYIRYCLL
jgi:hypothetical protein